MYTDRYGAKCWLKTKYLWSLVFSPGSLVS